MSYRDFRAEIGLKWKVCKFYILYAMGIYEFLNYGFLEKLSIFFLNSPL